MLSKVAILFDGGAFREFFGIRHNKELPTANDIVEHYNKIMESKELKGDELFRIYYYDCKPYTESVINPIDGYRVEFARTPTAQKMIKFLKEIPQKSKVAYREGKLFYVGWKIKEDKISKLKEINDKVRSNQQVSLDELKELPKYLEVDLRQKRIDMMIGLDIAWLASKRIVDKIVLVTSDTDFIPAMKFARREGIIVYLNPMKSKINEDLIIHSDDLIKIDLD